MFGGDNDRFATWSVITPEVVHPPRSLFASELLKPSSLPFADGKVVRIACHKALRDVVASRGFLSLKVVVVLSPDAVDVSYILFIRVGNYH